MTLVNYPLNHRQWVKTKTTKKYIVWHGSFGRTKYTPYGQEPGRATSTIDSWNNNTEKYGAPYLVDRDGTVYKTFDESEWIFHLNLPNTKGYYDKQSIPIVLANELNLLKLNSQLYAFEYPHVTNKYFGPVVELPETTTWKRQMYLAKLNEEQVDSIIELTLDMCVKHKIDPVFYIGNDFNPTVWNRATIFTHANVKKEALDLFIEPWVVDKIKTAGIRTVS